MRYVYIDVIFKKGILPSDSQPNISKRRVTVRSHSCGSIFTNRASGIGGFNMFVTIVCLSEFPGNT